MVIHIPAKYHQSMTKDKIVKARMQKMLQKIQLFDLEIEGQGHIKVVVIPDAQSYDNTSQF
jgi:predicted aspartyl protease